MKIFISFILFLAASTTFAQSAPTFMTTWKASTYVPIGYLGKALPTPGSTITVSFELLDGGRPADVSNTVVQWRVNEDILKTGRGIKTFSYSIPEENTNEALTVSIVTPYRGVERTTEITIPVVRPEIRIADTGTNNILTAGKHLLRGLFYFFAVPDVRDLSIIWKANGQETSGQPADPTSLELDTSFLAPGQTINLSVSASEPRNIINTVKFTKQLIIQ